jgi:dihydrofolate reductase
MMTTLNGRLDNPDSWVDSIDDEQYADIDRLYDSFDTIVVGSHTFAEMAAYWPAALTDERGYADSDIQTNQSMAKKMSDYTKYVISRTETPAHPTWANSRPVTITTDDELANFLDGLKHEPGADIHLAGGAELAQHCIRLGLVDVFRFTIYPIVSPGARWFDRTDTIPPMDLTEVGRYANGTMALTYQAR